MRTFSILFTSASLLSTTLVLLAACSGDETTSTSSSSSSSGTAGTGGTGGAGGAGGTGGTGGTGGGGNVVPGHYDCSPPSGTLPPLKLTEVANGLVGPALIKSSPGDDTRLYIMELPGRIRVLKNGTLLPDPFLDITSKVEFGGERGLLGLAFHPDYANNRRFFVYYSAKGTGLQTIEEYKGPDGDGDVANPTVVSQLIAYPDSQSNHNGGSLEFSPKDGYLYIGWGDEGGGGDQHGLFGNGQNLATLHGKIWRIDVDAGKSPYGIPPGNFTSIPAGNPTTGALRQEIWDYGLRNPWRVSFDACTGDLYIADVGQDKWEEIDVEPAGQGNKNYGWRITEGTHCYDPPSNCPTDGITMPVAEYDHSVGKSVTGGYVYRGSAIPALRGTYLYGDYDSGRIWSLTWANGAATAPVERTMDLQSLGMKITSFGQDDHGEVYVVTATGAIYRIDAE